MSFSHSPSLGITAGWGFVATILVLVIALQAGLLSGPRIFSGNVEGSFALYENGAYVFYDLKNGRVKKLPHPTPNIPAFRDGQPVYVPIYRSRTLPSGDTPVNLAAPDGATTIIGTERSDGTLIPLINNTIPKSVLTANALGALAFAELGESEENAPAPTSNNPRTWKIKRTSLYDPPPLTPEDIREGFAAAYGIDGRLTLLSKDGVVRVTPGTAPTTATVLEKPLHPETSALSPDATAVAIIENKTLSVLPLGTDSTPLSVPLPEEPQGISFINPTTLIIKVGNTSFSIYQITRDAFQKRGTAELKKP